MEAKKEASQGTKPRKEGSQGRNEGRGDGSQGRKEWAYLVVHQE